MPTITRDQVRVPADVMPEARDTYIENYLKATRGTGRLMLFACDQKVEHLNKDFYGEGIDISDAEPEHLFEIGSQGTIGVLAGQRGLIAQYANDYPEINYLVKMNSKTNLVKGSQEDPYSPKLMICRLFWLCVMRVLMLLALVTPSILALSMNQL